MSEREIYVAVLITATLPMCILFVLFGQVTVRRLRKDPETKNTLGMELASGWDIINVAQALSIPKKWSKKLENTPLSFMHANSEVLYKNTYWYDRFLARLFYSLLNIVGLGGIGLVILNSFGVFQ